MRALKKYFLFFACIFFINTLVHTSEQTPLEMNLVSTSTCHESIKKNLEQDLALNQMSVERKAILKGLLWALQFAVDNNNFDFIFSDYLTMLYELSLNKKDLLIRNAARQLIQQAYNRSLSRLDEIFDESTEGRFDLLSVLPILHNCGCPLQPLVTFYKNKLEDIDVSEYEKKFSRKVKKLDYDSLTDYLVDYSFVDLCYKMFPQDFIKLPRNMYQEVWNACSALQFVHDVNNEDGYHDQNYYVTHLVCAITNYGTQSIPTTAFTQRIFNYLNSNMHTILHKVKDIDLIGECLQCFKAYGHHSLPIVQEATEYLVSKQKNDGSWADDPSDDDDDEDEDDPYDIFHPVWTSIVALHCCYA